MKDIRKGKRKPRSKTLKLDETLEQVNPSAAGIDAGSEEHVVAVSPERDEEPTRTFGCMTPDLHEMARWLVECEVETVAIESTGVYWIPVAQVLEGYGLEVVLVDARQTKNVSGRKKTDVHDSQWIRKLHAYGLLQGAFRPTQQMRRLRTYWRQRKGLVAMSGKQTQLMHKALEQMNLQLHKALTDVTGVSGMRIIKAILAGERDPRVLAEMKHKGTKCSKATMIKALTGDYHEEHLFALRQAVELQEIFQEKIADCDRETERYMATLDGKGDMSTYDGRPQGSRRKNQAHFDLRRELYRLSGVDLTQIDGISSLTAQTVITECGIDMSQFPTEKHFCSWLGLSPHNEQTGGKIKRRRTRKVVNRASIALRVAAQSLSRSRTYLGAYLRRMKVRVGSPKAITATAHKLAKLIYRMLKHGTEYVDRGQEAYEQQYRERRLKYIRKSAKAMGFDLVAASTGELVS